jgi:hypothetical protein
MDNKQLTKLANALVTKRREKRAWLGGVLRAGNWLRKLGRPELVPRVFQIAAESRKAFGAMNEGNILKMLGSARMPGMAAAPKLPSMVRPSNIKRLQQLAKEVPGTFKNINRSNINKILPRRGGINIPGMKPPALPSRLAPPPPISTRIPNPNFRPKTDGGMWRSPSHTGPPSPFSHPMQ